MRLRFKGKDGSLGLRHGRVYRLAVRPWREGGVYITFPVACPYTSEEAFWANWENPKERDDLSKKKVPLVVYTDGRRNEIGEAVIELWPGEVRVEGIIDGVGDISGVVPIVNDETLDPRYRIY